MAPIPIIDVNKIVLETVKLIWDLFLMAKACETSGTNEIDNEIKNTDGK